MSRRRRVWFAVILVSSLVLLIPSANAMDNDMTLALSGNKKIYLPGETVSLTSAITGPWTERYSMDFNKTISWARYLPNSAKVVTDNKYVYMTAFRELPDVNRGVLLIKFDLNGTEVWNRTWGISSVDYPMNLILHKDVLYIVGSSGDGIWPDPMFLLAYSSTGMELWNQTWGGAQYDWGTGLVIVGDSLYISGSTRSFGAGIFDVLLLKFNLTLNAFEWYKTWGDAGNQYGGEITCLNNALYLNANSTSFPGNASILKYDMNGNFVWARTWNDSGSDSTITNDGTKILVAGSRNEAGSLWGFVRIYSERGDFLAEKLFGKPGYIYTVSNVRAQNGIAYCVGRVRSSQSANSSDVALVAFDYEDGGESQNITWGGLDEDQGSGIALGDNSEIFCVGGTKSFIPGTPRLFFLRYSKPRLADIPNNYSIKAPSDQPFLTLNNQTNPSGNATISFQIPLDAPEGQYTFIVNSNLSGIIITNITFFNISWPWSPVLTLDSPSAIMSCQPGDTLSLRAHAGYEYPPANGKKSAAETAVSADLLFPNGTLYMTIANATEASGWANFSLALPKSTPAGNYTVRLRGFEGLSRDIHIEVLKPAGKAVQPDRMISPVPVAPVLGSASVTILVIVVLVAGTEVGKFGLLAPFAPLYSRIRRDKALDNRIRHQILGYLTENPGEHYTALKRALRLSNSVIVYHLLILEQGGFVKSQRDGTMKRFYPSSVKAPEKHQRTPEELTEDILEAVARSPGITRRELVESLVVSEEVIAYRLRKLARERRVTALKMGKTRVYYPVKSS